MNSSTHKLIVIAGPTAVGKTDLCLKLAKELDTEIISADSRQFFRELSIGTAKPSAQELNQVPHHFINSHSIAEEYSAGDFERDALLILNELFRRKDNVILTGGSGLYIKAVCEGLDDLPRPIPGLRDELMRQLREDGLEFLQNEALRVDPVFSGTPEFFNPQRVVRALEVFYTSGRPISSYQNQHKAERPFQSITVALERERNELYHRIESRVDHMLDAGLVQEARSVLPYRDHHALKTVGYKEVFGFLDGDYDEAEMIRLLKQNTRRYAKRQLTWFRHQGNYTWFQADEYQKVRDWVLGKVG
ncbi:tRNA (adenosine(37)-N6)-dimethylallyltransferase MiaA [Salmonirosea aquatica]|uniref:tRNA dimethylallyltransferase n=1 Tax=Salmonirosea aquatica TaxID=2654236 RepID=A0A7C9BFJ6_9BACT|nr:tRNA (adenosine(37)-N6)-dimethylallyltransferase MiaA [Cytophagaceae bacterium SJW1-29]